MMNVLLFVASALAGLTTSGQDCNARLDTLDAVVLDEALLGNPDGAKISDLVYGSHQAVQFELDTVHVGQTIEVAFLYDGSPTEDVFGYYLADPQWESDIPFLDSDNASFLDYFDLEAVWKGTSHNWENDDTGDTGGGDACMTTGHTMVYEVESGDVGKRFGFWVQRDGVDDGKGAYWFSDDAVNTDGNGHFRIIPAISDATVVYLYIETDNQSLAGHRPDFSDLVVRLAFPDSLDVEKDWASQISGAISPGFDTDRDGVPDFFDDFPDDGDRSFNNIYPSGYGKYTVMTEDLYPSAGDKDFNDNVQFLQVFEHTDATGDIAQVNFIAEQAAMGAGMNHSWYLNIPDVGPGAYKIKYVDLEDGSALPAMDVNLTTSTSNADMLIFKDYRDEFGPLSMTQDAHESAYLPGLRASGKFAPTSPVAPTDMAYPPYDPWTLNLDSNYEIHTFEHPHLYGMVPDTSDTGGYVDANGMPWMIYVPQQIEWSTEKTDMETAYPLFDEWYESQGQSYTTWWGTPSAAGADLFSFDPSYFAP